MNINLLYPRIFLTNERDNPIWYISFFILMVLFFCTSCQQTTKTPIPNQESAVSKRLFPIREPHALDKLVIDKNFGK